MKESNMYVHLFFILKKRYGNVSLLHFPNIDYQSSGS